MTWTAEISVPALGIEAPIIGSPDEVEVSDGGCALIFNIEESNRVEGFFVQLRSWANLDERVRACDGKRLRKAHPEFAQFAGKRIRVTVEVIDGE